MDMKGVRGGGGDRERETHPGQDLQECGQLQQSLGRFESPENS